MKNLYVISYIKNMKCFNLDYRDTYKLYKNILRRYSKFRYFFRTKKTYIFYRKMFILLNSFKQIS